MSIEQQGYEIRKNLVPLKLLLKVLDELENDNPEISPRGIRQADKKLPAVQAIVSQPEIVKTASDILQGEARLVRVIVFDKNPEVNWSVSWHQDRTVAVSNKMELEGWGPWSVKEGIHHVQPPLSVLEKMVTLRIHLDRADEANGCLRVIPASHKLGIINQSNISANYGTQAGVACMVDAGDTVIMRPHLLHRSKKATRATHRRVIHAEYSTYRLPKGLSWV